MAFESRRDGKAVDQAIMISCDLVAIRQSVLEKVRAHLQPLLPEVDMRKVILTATHTHTAPVTTRVERQPQPLRHSEGRGDAARRLHRPSSSSGSRRAAVQAWQSRKPGGVSWTLGHAVVGQNRRMVYADGHAQMYGKTNMPNFRSLEGAEDHAVETLFLLGRREAAHRRGDQPRVPFAGSGKPQGASMRTSGTTRASSFEAELKLPDLTILGWCSAAGDQSPHLQYRKAAEERMMKARGLTRLQELGRRISRAVVDTLDVAQADIRADVPFAHTVETLALPPRIILQRERDEAAKNIAQFSALKNPTEVMRTHAATRARKRCSASTKRTSCRLRNGAARPAHRRHRDRDESVRAVPRLRHSDESTQPRVADLCHPALVRLRRLSAHAESDRRRQLQRACPHSNKVGPEGGEMLVNRTLDAIRAHWPQQPAAPEKPAK